MPSKSKTSEKYGMKGREFHIEDAYQIFMGFSGYFWWEVLRPKMVEKGLITTENYPQEVIEKFPPEKRDNARLYSLNSKVFGMGSDPSGCTNDLKNLIIKRNLIESQEGIEKLQIREEDLFQLVIDFCRLWNERCNERPERFLNDPISFGIETLENMRKHPEFHQSAWKVWDETIGDRIINKRVFEKTSFKARMERARGGLGDLSCLLEEAKRGTLTDEEFSYLVKRLQNHESETHSDLYTLIHAIGKADMNHETRYSNPRGLQHRKLIEGFLYYPKYPMIASIALTVLCNFWVLIEDYLNLIRDFIAGVDWDQNEDVKLTAIGSAGEYLYNHQVRGEKEVELIQLIAAIAEDETKREGTREMAYEALARASGASWEEIYEHPADEEDQFEA